MTTQNIEFTLNQADIKEASKLALARAQSLDLKMNYQQMLEIISAAFGAQNYHQVARTANGELPILVNGQTENLYEMIDLALSTCGVEQVLHVACLAESSCGEVSLCDYTFNRESLRSIGRWVYQGAKASELRLDASFHDSEYAMYEEAHGDHQHDCDGGEDFVLHAMSIGKHAGGRAWTERELNMIDMIEGLVIPLARKAKGEPFEINGFTPCCEALFEGAQAKEYLWASPIRFEYGEGSAYLLI